MPITYLLAPLQDQNWSVRNAAQMILDEQGGRLLSDPTLMVALKHESAGVRSAVVRALGEQGERAPVDLLIQALRDESEDVRSAAMEALGEHGDRVQQEQLLPLLGDDDANVRYAAIEIVSKLAPAMLTDVINEAIVILQGKPAGKVLGSLIEGFIAEVLGNIGYATPMVFDKLISLLDWHYWQVQVKAARVLGKIRRNIPDLAIKRLLAMRNDPSPLTRNIREAADDALSEILSLETGIEDE